jgi:hypothetical protein
MDVLKVIYILTTAFRPRISFSNSYYFFFRGIRSSSSLPSRDKLSRESIKSHLYFRYTSQGGLGFRLSPFRDKLSRGHDNTTLLSGTLLNRKKGLKIHPFQG